MAEITVWLRSLQLHPIVDHFTIALLFVAVFIDLVASVFSSHAWLRYTALTLMVLGAIAAAGSWLTGGYLQPHWVFKTAPDAAKAILHRHEELGEALMYVFAVLAIWRILLEAFAFMAGTRWIYLIAALVSIGVLGYQGSLGGELVYRYGVGTALVQPAAAATATESGAQPSSGAIPTVTVPTATPSASPAAEGSASPEASPAASPAASPTASARPKPTAAAL